MLKSALYFPFMHSVEASTSNLHTSVDDNIHRRIRRRQLGKGLPRKVYGVSCFDFSVPGEDAFYIGSHGQAYVPILKRWHALRPGALLTMAALPLDEPTPPLPPPKGIVLLHV